MQSSSKVLAQNMADELMSMPLDEAIPLTRACGALYFLSGPLDLARKHLQYIKRQHLYHCILVLRRALSQPHTDCRDPSQV